MEFKDKLKAFRLEQNITQEEMAKILQVNTRSYQRYEAGTRLLSVSKLELLALEYPFLDFNIFFD